MNSIKQIGRYMLPLGVVAATQERPKRTGWRRFLFWRKPGYDAILNNGRVIYFTYQEKQAYDTAMAWHDVTLDWVGMAKGMGLRM